MADILDREILVPVGTDAAFGAALLAGVATGVFAQTPETINGMIRFRSHHRPTPKDRDLYNHLFGLYREAASAIQEISHKLHQFQTDCQVAPSEEAYFPQDLISNNGIISIPD
jgi:sugar (pentulose or hexulose) kinase